MDVKIKARTIQNVMNAEVMHVADTRTRFDDQGPSASKVATTIRDATVFISYSSEDRQFVRALTRSLQSEGISVWVDEELTAGAPLVSRIFDAISRANFVVVALSRAAIASSWVQKELETAIGQEIKLRRVVVIPVLLEPVTLPVCLQDKLCIRFEDTGFDSGVAKLLDAIRSTPPSSP